MSRRKGKRDLYGENVAQWNQDPARRRRDTARLRIMTAATKQTSNQKYMTAKHLQRAVFVCRRFMLVSNDTLIEAGFNPMRNADRTTTTGEVPGKYKSTGGPAQKAKGLMGSLNAALRNALLPRKPKKDQT